MYADIPLWLSLVFLAGGLAALAWSSDFFVDGASVLAKALGISPFIIGMVIIGFGTSAPELCVSAMSGMSGHPELSLGNAYGSCIFNIAVILGVAVMIFPLVVKPGVVFVAGPALALISLLSIFILRDGVCSRAEATALLVCFAILLPAYCWFDQKTKRKVEVEGEKVEVEGGKVEVEGGKVEVEGGKVEGEGGKVEGGKGDGDMVEGRGRMVLIGAAKTLVGLGVLMGSSHFLVWGAVDFAKAIGVSDLVIGLTIVAAGTSLPELASAIASARRGEHEFVLGNIVGSNFFNTLAVVGVATAITPIVPPGHTFSPYILWRDLPFMTLLSILITLFGLNWRHPKWPGVITRKKAAIWLLAFVAYTLLMLYQETTH